MKCKFSLVTCQKCDSARCEIYQAYLAMQRGEIMDLTMEP